MLQNAPFGFDLVKKYVVLFGSTFNNIYIERKDSANNVMQKVKVPISYSEKDKMLAVVDDDPFKDQPYSTILPRIGFALTSFQYDTARKVPTNNYIGKISNTNPSIVNKQYVFVPYNLSFELYIMTKFTEDGSRIIEQITPFFTPDYISTAILIPEMGYKLDIPIVLNGISNEDLYDGDFKNRRAIVWTLNFTLKGVLCGPIRTPGLIKFVQTTFYNALVPDGELQDAVGHSSPLERINVQVTLTANGEPTANVAESIPYREININDDYGFGVTIQGFSGNTIVDSSGL